MSHLIKINHMSFKSNAQFRPFFMTKISLKWSYYYSDLKSRKCSFHYSWAFNGPHNLLFKSHWAMSLVRSYSLTVVLFHTYTTIMLIILVDLFFSSVRWRNYNNQHCFKVHQDINSVITKSIPPRYFWVSPDSITW